MHLSDRVKSARIEAALTQEGLAKKVGVSKSAVSNWERGEAKDLRMDHLFAVARHTKVSPEWLATGRGRRKPAIGVDPYKAPYYDAIDDMSDDQLEALKLILKALNLFNRSGRGRPPHQGTPDTGPL